MWEAIKTWTEHKVAQFATWYCSVRVMELEYQKRSWYPDFWHTDDLRSSFNVRPEVSDETLIELMDTAFKANVSAHFEELNTIAYNAGLLEPDEYPTEDDEE